MQKSFQILLIALLALTLKANAIDEYSEDHHDFTKLPTMSDDTSLTFADPILRKHFDFVTRYDHSFTHPTTQEQLSGSSEECGKLFDIAVDVYNKNMRKWEKLHQINAMLNNSVDFDRNECKAFSGGYTWVLLVIKHKLQVCEVHVPIDLHKYSLKRSGNILNEKYAEEAIRIKDTRCKIDADAAIELARSEPELDVTLADGLQDKAIEEEIMKLLSKIPADDQEAGKVLNYIVNQVYEDFEKAKADRSSEESWTALKEHINLLRKKIDDYLETKKVSGVEQVIAEPDTRESSHAASPMEVVNHMLRLKKTLQPKSEWENKLRKKKQGSESDSQDDSDNGSLNNSIVVFGEDSEEDAVEPAKDAEKTEDAPNTDEPTKEMVSGLLELYKDEKKDQEIKIADDGFIEVVDRRIKSRNARNEKKMLLEKVEDSERGFTVFNQVETINPDSTDKDGFREVKANQGFKVNIDNEENHAPKDISDSKRRFNIFDNAERRESESNQDDFIEVKGHKKFISNSGKEENIAPKNVGNSKTRFNPFNSLNTSDSLISDQGKKAKARKNKNQFANLKNKSKDNDSLNLEVTSDKDNDDKETEATDNLSSVTAEIQNDTSSFVDVPSSEYKDPLSLNQKIQHCSFEDKKRIIDLITVLNIKNNTPQRGLYTENITTCFVGSGDTTKYNLFVAVNDMQCYLSLNVKSDEEVVPVDNPDFDQRIPFCGEYLGI